MSKQIVADRRETLDVGTEPTRADRHVEPLAARLRRNTPRANRFARPREPFDLSAARVDVTAEDEQAGRTVVHEIASYFS